MMHAHCYQPRTPRPTLRLLAAPIHTPRRHTALISGPLGNALDRIADGRWNDATIRALLQRCTPSQINRVLAVEYATRLQVCYGLNVTPDEVRARLQQIQDGEPTPLSVTALIDSSVGRFVWNGNRLHIYCAIAPYAMCNRSARGGDLGSEGTLDVWRICKQCLNRAYRAGLLHYTY